MFIEINGLPYAVAQGADLAWTYAQVLTTPFRLSGVPTPQDNQLVSRFKLDWQRGVGYKRQLRSEEIGIGGLQDASAMTWWASQLTLPLLQQDPTEPDDTTEMAVSRFPFEFQGNLWMAGEDDDTQDLAHVIQWDGATEDWGVGVQDVSSSSNNHQCQDYVISGAFFVLMYIQATNHQIDRDSSAALSSLTNSTTDITAGLLTNAAGQANIDAGRMVELNGTIFAAVWHEDVSTMTMFTSADDGDVWTDRAVDVPSTSGVTGRCSYVDLNGDAAPLFSTRDAIWAYDVSANSWQEFFRFPSADDNNGRGMVCARGSVFCGGGTGEVWKVTLEAVAGGIRGVVGVNVGPTRQRLDGLIAERQGFVTVHQMYASAEFLDYGYGGQDASHKASIIRMRFDDESLHFYHRHDTANQKMQWLTASQLDDATFRMHFAVRTGTADTDEQFTENPFDNPAAGATITYAVTGLVDHAEDDMGDELTPAGAFEAVISVDDVTAGTSGEFIDYSTGSDAEAHGTDDRGDFNSTTKSLRLSDDEAGDPEVPATGQGISVNTLKHRLVLNRDGADLTQSPKVKRFEVRAVNSQAVLRAVTIPIDLGKTKERFDRDVEAQITDLEAVATDARQQLVSIGKFPNFRANISFPPSVDMSLKLGDEEQEEGIVDGILVIRVNQLLEGV